jgi:uncharacterized membrane protein
MPNIGYYHPIIVHFAVAFLIAGVLLRLASLTGWPRLSFAKPAATVFLLVGTLCALAAARSGTDAHGPVERVPGAREAVQEHEELGERARNVFVVVGLLEVLGLFLARKKRERFALIASGLVGAVGLFFLYEAAEHGGALVYSYAGGVGVRTGNDEDVGRLLLAGLYNQAQLDRKLGNHEDAASLVQLAVARHPGDAEVELMAAESLLLDQKDPERALDALAAMRPDDPRLRIRQGLLEVDAYVAAGDSDKARARLEALVNEFPQNSRLKRRLDQFGHN